MELTVNGRRAFAVTGGRAFDLALPTVALLHGAGMEHSIWALQSRALAHHGRNVVALDFPGHGLSDGPPLATVEALADWVLAALKAVGATQFRLAGHSFGALVALETASRAGSSCERLALVGFAPEMRVHLAAELMVAWSFGLGGLTGGNPAPGLFLPESALRLIERAPAASLAADLAACDAYRGSLAAAQRVSCPVLLLLGDQDGMTPARQGEAFARHFAQAQVKILRDTGHMMMVEQPRATLDSLFAAL